MGPEQCIRVLNQSRGIDTSGIQRYLRRSVSRDPLFVKYLVVIMHVESSFRPYAVSHKDAYGLMQMTQEAVTDAARYCGLPHMDVRAMLVPGLAVQYGSCYLRKLHGELNGDWTRILIVYNGGYRQLTRHIEGGTLHNETATYLYKVHSALNKCGGTN